MRSARRASSVTTGGQLAERARADGVPVIPVAGRASSRARRSATRSSPRSRSPRSAAPRRACTSEIDVAAAHLEALVVEWGPDGAEDVAGQVARARSLHGTVPVIAGAGLTAPLAYRWKRQINENAKLPAFAHELPELDHNELVGWEGARSSAGSPRCSSTIPTRTRGSSAASSSPSD